jgi:exopolyphosphatase/guanosine-5'-triphosphate,3'-diphosphate pyrophosphatase
VRPPIERPTLVLDIGGGSTELVVAGPAGASRYSITRLVRLTDVLHDPPSASELGACAGHVAASIPEDLVVDDAIGVAGTITTLAAIELGMEEYDRDRIHGHRLTLEAIEREVERLSLMPLTVRESVTGLHRPGASDRRQRDHRPRTLSPASTRSRSAARHPPRNRPRGAQLPEPVEGDAPPGAYTCC